MYAILKNQKLYAEAITAEQAIQTANDLTKLFDGNYLIKEVTERELAELRIKPTEKGRLSYLRKANKYNDGADGLVYLHTWSTGRQELIFENEYDAMGFAITRNLKYGNAE